MAAIDGLRAIAVLMVVSFHFLGRYPNEYTGLSLAPTFTFGWLGVDLFFVISGYCIAMTASHTPDLASFWGRRFGRIYPAFAVGCLVTWGLTSYFGLPGKEVSILQAIGNLLFLNVALVPSVDGVYWSLLVELRFYMVYGLILCIDRRPLAIVSGLSALFFLGVWLEYIGSPLRILITRPEYIVLFLIGAALFFAHATGKRIFYFWAICGYAASFTTGYYDAVVPYALVTLGLGCLSIASRKLPVLDRLWPIGLVSYSWYLLHQNIGLIIIRFLSIRGAGDGVAIAIATASTFILALGLFVLCENRKVRMAANQLFARIFEMLQFHRLAKQRSSFR